MRQRWLLAATVLLVTIVAVLPIAATAANPTSDEASTQGFRKAVTLAGIRQHQAALQAIGDANNRTRVSGTKGFDDSVEYVYNRAVAAGYNVSVQQFTFTFVGDQSPPVFQKLSPAPAKTYTDGVDFGTMSYSGSGDVTASLTAVDLSIPPGPNPGTGSTSGCEASDFAGFPAGTIALMQRGTCTFRVKAVNAQAAGASAAVIMNEGNSGRTGLLSGTLSPPQLNFPVIGTTFALGNELRNGVVNGPTGVTVRLKTDVIAETRTTRNVIAESPGGDPNRVIVIGAHLDSVSRGPGINDNGSGSATILELAETFTSQLRETRNKLRFMWYGAEEFGLIGSTYYVNNLPQAERDKIELMLNFDMVGSPNFVRFIYDGNNSSFPPGANVQTGPAGSGAIEQVFIDYFASQGLASEPTPFSGRSDYGPFITIAKIPAGGLFTGAEGLKTAAQAAIYGGTAGAQYDPCYHLACDTFTNVSETGLDQMSDAAAHAFLLFSKRDFAREPLVDPAVAAASGGGAGGGLHDGPSGD